MTQCASFLPRMDAPVYSGRHYFITFVMEVIFLPRLVCPFACQHEILEAIGCQIRDNRLDFDIDPDAHQTAGFFSHCNIEQVHAVILLSRDGTTQLY